ncbi:unnamed protein product [Heterobilharzia americana]|nr:unnamed protein product [Heterobilharzia americana]
MGAMRRNFSLPPERKSRRTAIAPSKTRAPSFGGQEQRPVQREVKSKTKFGNMIGNLIQFLETTDYSNSLSTKFLSSPNSKEIFSIFEHLVRQIDSTFRIEFDGTKAEEVCINTLKMLGYPHILSKHHLSAPGAPQAWNSVLTAFDWLREEIEVPIILLNFQCSLTMMSRILKRCEGSDITACELEDYNSRINKALCVPSEEDIKMLHNRLDEVNKQMNALNNMEDEENSLRAQLVELESNIRSLDMNLCTFESGIHTVKSSDEELTEDLNELNKEVKKLEGNLATVRGVLKEQEDAGYGRLAQEFLMLRERLNARMHAKEELSKQVEQKELDYTRREGIIAPTLDAYNRLVGSLRVHEFSAIAKSCNLEVCTYRKGFDISKQIPLLVKNVKACVEQFTVAVFNNEEVVQELTERIKKLQSLIDCSELPGVQARLIEVKTEFSKLDELLTEEDDAHTKAEEEYAKVCAQRIEELEDLKKQLIQEEQRQTELNERLGIIVQNRMKLSSHVENVSQQLSSFIPYIESYFKTKESADRTWQMHVNLLREEIQSTARRIENKVQKALEQYAECKQ